MPPVDNNLSPSNRLIPANGRERISVLRWEALADGINDAAATIFIEEKRPSNLISTEWVARQHSKIALGLQAASHDLGENPWCSGNKLSLADIALGAALGYLDFRFASLDWRSQYANLAALMDKLLIRQSFIDTEPKA